MNKKAVDSANAAGSKPADKSKGPQDAKLSAAAKPPVTPIGQWAILVFELYFLVLGILTAYALWRIWPYENADQIVRIFSLEIDFIAGTDARLLLIAMLAGLLGALVHVTTSFTSYLGNEELHRSWVPWYALRPLIGLILGLLFYLIVRAGLVTASGADAVNAFGVAAISGLAGLFSKQTVDKLRDVFEYAFPVRKGGDEDRDSPLSRNVNGDSNESGDSDAAAEVEARGDPKTGGSD